MDATAILEVLDTLTVADLRQVAERASELLSFYEEMQQGAGAIETRDAQGGCYRLELVRWGKANSRKCAEGPGHGPYWYQYRSVKGKLKKVYIGRKLNP